jgi:hypothetical protein
MYDVLRTFTPAARAALLLLTAVSLTAIACGPAIKGGRPVRPGPPPTSIAGSLSMTFWAHHDATPPQGAVAGSNACGPTLTIVSMSVPTNNPALEPSKVNQIDENANVLRSWPVPINLTPVALDGEHVLLRGWDKSQAMLQVRTDGIVSVRSVPQLARPEPTACPPRPVDQYAAEVLCVSTHDIATKERVLLEFEQPCE